MKERKTGHRPCVGCWKLIGKRENYLQITISPEHTSETSIELCERLEIPLPKPRISKHKKIHDRRTCMGRFAKKLQPPWKIWKWEKCYNK